METWLNQTNIKAMLGIPTSVTRYDSAITETIAATEQIITDELNLDSIYSTSYTDKIDVTTIGLNEVSLSYTPIISVAGVTIKKETQVENTDYVINKRLGVIKLLPLSSYFPTGREVVVVSYTAGFADSASIPKDLTYAGHLICCSLFNQQSHVGFKSERAGNYSYNLGNATGSTIPAMAQRILGKYYRVFARGMKIQ